MNHDKTHLKMKIEKILWLIVLIALSINAFLMIIYMYVEQ